MPIEERFGCVACEGGGESNGNGRDAMRDGRGCCQSKIEKQFINMWKFFRRNRL